MRKLQKSIIVILILGIIGLAVYPAINSGTANAKQRVWSNGYHEFSPKSEKLFKLASYYFYKARGELSEVPCQPQDVHIVYGDYGTEEYAHVKHIGDAWPYDDNRNNGYCNVYFNVRYIRPRADNCVIFMHEYGHLLGKRHNDNIQSPMYNGYVYENNWRYGDVLYNSNRRNIFSKSVCNAPKIFQEPFPPPIKFG